jgi:uncharacterized protein (UPF0332 family)
MCPLPAPITLFFYAASALLLNEGIDTRKHSGVIALIHQNFVKNGKVSKEQGRNLNWLLNSEA